MNPQTITEIQRHLTQHGLEPQRALGQNFLIDGNLMRMIVDSAELDSARDVVLEIGPGTGSLTALLAERAARLVAVETDKKLTPILTEVLAPFPNVTLLVRDALSSKHELAPELLSALNSRLAAVSAALSSATRAAVPTADASTVLYAVPPARLKLVANLPYHAATPIIMNLLLGQPRPDLLVFTVQKEVADRLAARVDGAAYGPISVLVRALAEVELLRDFSPTVFWPRPNVHSTLVRIRPDPARYTCLGDLDLFHRVAAGLFAHRRKTCAKSLEHAPGLESFRGRWPALLAAAAIPPDTRGEHLDLDRIIALAHAAGKSS
jgi:16S rRNA (adenine1518-N6/adenine1519-N6)-dimethyltransferase